LTRSQPPTFAPARQIAIGVLRSYGEPRRVLVTRRRDDAPLAGYWELPGGKMREGETPEACVCREFLEEVAVQIEVIAALPVIEHAYDHGRVRLHPFYCRSIAGEVRDVEVAEHRWVPAEELASLRLPPANALLTRRIIEDAKAGRLPRC
jgi:8-oxo-dGTP diphosphatase